MAGATALTGIVPDSAPHSPLNTSLLSLAAMIRFIAAAVILIRRRLADAETQLRGLARIDPLTGHHYDDTKRYIEATPHLSAEARRDVYERNARRVYPRIDKALRARGQ